MRRSYPICLHKDPGSAYGVSVPDVPGCFSAGDTFEDALAMAKEAIEFHIDVITSQGDPIPEPSTIGRWVDVEGYDDATAWAFVEVELPQHKAVPAGVE